MNDDIINIAKQGYDYLNRVVNDEEIKCDAIKDQNKIIYLFDLPGVEKENIKIQITDDNLTIQSKRIQKGNLHGESFTYFYQERNFNTNKRMIKIPHPPFIDRLTM